MTFHKLAQPIFFSDDGVISGKNFTVETITNEKGSLLIFHFVNVSKKKVFFPSWFVSFHNQIKSLKNHFVSKGQLFTIHTVLCLEKYFCQGRRNINISWCEKCRICPIAFVLRGKQKSCKFVEQPFWNAIKRAGRAKIELSLSYWGKLQNNFFKTNRDILKIRPWQYESLKNLVAWFTSYCIPSNEFSFKETAVEEKKASQFSCHKTFR